MVRWCFAGDNVSDLFRIQGTLDQHGYHSILQRYAIPSGLRLVGLKRADINTIHTSVSWLRVQERLTASLIFINSPNCLHSQITHRADTHTYPTRGLFSPQIQNKFKKAYSITQSHYCMELHSISYCSNNPQTWFQKTDKATPHSTMPHHSLSQIRAAQPSSWKSYNGSHPPLLRSSEKDRRTNAQW